MFPYVRGTTWCNIYIAFTQSAVSTVTISCFLFSLKFCTLCYIKERRFVRLQKSLGHDGGDRLSIVDCVDINYNKSSPIHRKKLNLSIWDHNISNEFKIIIKSVTTRSISKIETDLLTSLRSLRALRIHHRSRPSEWMFTMTSNRKQIFWARAGYSWAFQQAY